MADKLNFEKPDTRSLKWYKPNLTEVNPNFRKLLEAKGIPSDQVLQHIHDVREKAWAIHQYPCLGEFMFTWISSVNEKVFPEILEKLKASATLLDFGCGFGQELRKIEDVGVDSKNLAGLDKDADMIQFGYDLFQDKNTFKAQFFTADMLALETVPTKFYGSFDFILANCSIHLFDWDKQLLACRTALTLLKPSIGSTIFGIQIGRTQAAPNEWTGMYIHDVDSFKKLWTQAGREFGYTIEVTANMAKMQLQSLVMADTDIKTMHFAVKLSGMAKL